MNFLRGLPTALGATTVALSGYTAIRVAKDSETRRQKLTEIHDETVEQSHQTRVLIQRVFNQNEGNATAVASVHEKVDIIKHNVDTDSNALTIFALGTAIVSIANLAVSLIKN